MVKYACKVTSSRCLSQSFTAVHEDVPKCMPEEFLLLEPVKLNIRGFESRRALQNVSPVDWFCPSGRKKRTVHEIVCENVFIQTFVIIRQSESASVHLAEQCKSKPCLRVDTVLSQTVPKDIFPRCAGSTQIFSRCFCMDDSGIKRNYDWSDYNAFLLSHKKK